MVDTEKDGRKLDRLWLLFLVVTGAVLSVVLAESFFDVTVSMSGIVCVGLIATGRREGYLIGLYNSGSYAVLAYNNGLFGEMYLNLLFFLPTGIIGFFMWKRQSDNDNTVIMRKLNWMQRLAVVSVCVICTLGLGLLLGLNPKQNTPLIDASTNVISIVATLLMMWRFMEQWALYITLNIITIVMWTLRTINGGDGGGLMVLMWSLFLLNAIYGCWRWNKGARETTTPLNDSIPEVELCDAD